MKNILRTSALCIILAIFPAGKHVHAQAVGDFWELGLFGGVTQYYGDLQHSLFEPEEANPVLGVFARYSPNKNLSFRTGIYRGTISGHDRHGGIEHQKRNLHFRSKITEVSLIGEWNLMGFNMRRKNRDDFTPYIFAGIGVFRFNPQAEFDGEWHDLQPLSTEGQGLPDYFDRDPYSLTQFTIPMGVGIKYQISNRVTVAFEIAHRKTFTDYLDDVSTTHVDKEELLVRRGGRAMLLSDRSGETPFFDEAVYGDGDTRGNPDTDDWYAFFGFTISFNPITQLCPM